MKKREIQEAYQRFFIALPREKRLELDKCSNVGEIMDLAERYNYPLSMEECLGICKILAYPEHHYKMPDVIE